MAATYPQKVGTKTK